MDGQGQPRIGLRKPLPPRRQLLPRPGLQLRHLGRRQRKRGKGLARDGVARRAALQGDQAQVKAFGQLAQRLRQQLDGIAAAEMDVDAGVAAAQPGHLQPHRRIAWRQVFPAAIVAHLHIHPTGAAQVEVAPFLGIQVDQPLAVQGAGRQFARAVHARFLVDGEQHLQRRMNQPRLLQRGQRQRHADTVVGAQRGVLGRHPAVAHHRLDRVTLEIVHRAGIGLAHHVEVALQNYAGLPFAAGAGGLLQDQVAGAINLASDPALFRPGDQVFAQRGLVQRRARDRTQRGEMRPDGARLQVFKRRRHI